MSSLTREHFLKCVPWDCIFMKKRVPVYISTGRPPRGSRVEGSLTFCLTQFPKWLNLFPQGKSMNILLDQCSVVHCMKATWKITLRGSEKLWLHHPPIFLSLGKWMGLAHSTYTRQMLICHKGRGVCLLKVPHAQKLYCLLLIPL